MNERIDISTFRDVLNFERSQPLGDLWPEKTYYERLQYNAKQFGDRPAVSFHLMANPNAGSETLTWAELLREVTKFANYLRSIGVQDGDSVALLLPSSGETVIALLAAMTVGIAAPINPTLSADRIAAILRSSDAKVLVTLKSFPKSDLAQLGSYAASTVKRVQTIVEVDLGEHLHGIRKQLLSYVRPKNEIEHHAKIVDFKQALKQHSGEFLTFEETPQDRVCAYFHTGGTTGAPKVVQHTRLGGMYNGWMLGNMMITQEDVVICPLPLFHVFAVYPIMMGCLFRGAHLVLPTPAGFRGDGVVKGFWKIVEHWKGTFFAAVPTAIIALNKVKPDADISSLKSVFCGSAPMTPATFEQFKEVTGVEIIEGYGMSEATCVVSCNPRNGERRIGSVGFALPYFDITIAIFDDDGNFMRNPDFDEVGEICIAGPSVLVGETYKFEDNNRGTLLNQTYLRTGDLGRVDRQGYIWITGRSKDIIIRGGNNIDPMAIEETAMRHPAVKLAAAIGQPDPSVGELPVVYVELEPSARGRHAPSADALRAFLEQELDDPISVPKHVEIVPLLELTAVGKVYKPALRKMAIQRVFEQIIAENDFDLKVLDVVDNGRGALEVVIDRLDQNFASDELEIFTRTMPVEWRWAT